TNAVASAELPDGRSASAELASDASIQTTGSSLASRPCRIVDCGLVKGLELAIQSPVADLAHVGGTIWSSITPLVVQRIRAARTTLVFVNNRAQAEKMAARIN